MYTLEFCFTYFCHRFMKSLTVGLNYVSRSRLFGWTSTGIILVSSWRFQVTWSRIGRNVADLSSQSSFIHDLSILSIWTGFSISSLSHYHYYYIISVAMSLVSLSSPRHKKSGVRTWVNTQLCYTVGGL